MLIDGTKFLTVKDLQTALAKIDGNYLLRINKLGNLAVYLPTDKPAYIGYIDFHNGEADVDIPDEKI